MSMTAGNIVGMLARQNPDISRTDMLEQVDFIHRLMTGDRSELTKILDPDTGIDYKITIPSASFDVEDVLVGVAVNTVDKLYSLHYSIPLMGVHTEGSLVKVPLSAVGNSYYIRMYRPAKEILDEMAKSKGKYTEAKQKEKIVEVYGKLLSDRINEIETAVKQSELQAI